MKGLGETSGEREGGGIMTQCYKPNLSRNCNIRLFSFSLSFQH